MNSNDIRDKYLNFFKEKGHTILPSASLIPENDPSVLFTTAGMHPLVPFLLGEKHPAGKRLVNIQKCIRTGDIDEVGDNSHLTFFEMMGNWSLGDYWKKDAIEMTLEFHSKVLKIPLEKYAVSCFAGDNDAPKDIESFDIWVSLGIPKERIAFLPKKDNWWGPAGEVGPCGPDTEMFYWTGSEAVPKGFEPENKNWVEIGNDVLMQYIKNKEGIYEEAKQKNIDFGGGLERTLVALNGLDDVYKTDIFLPIIKKIEEISGKEYKGNERPFRIIADHIKTATFILGDEKGIAPSNTGQGYVLRRLVRRAVRYGKQLGINNFTREIASAVVQIYKNIYPELNNNKEFIFSNLQQEEEKFEKTLENGLREFEKGVDAFTLFTSYGFPLELSIEMAKETGKKIDVEEFNKKFAEHQNASRTASAGMFKGGLSDASEENTKLHTATHILHQALHDVLGDEVGQKGSNITAERLRFDFSFPRKLTDDEKGKVEEIVNHKIQEALPMQNIILPKEEAMRTGARHFFDQKYPDQISIYFIGDKLESAWSKEFCGGPHVKNTKDLGRFRIIKEEAVSAGVRRIKAVLE